MNTNLTWSTTRSDEKAILYNNYLYHLKRENQNGSSIYVCTFKWCSRTITLKNNVTIKSNGGNHNHDPKVPENVQTKFCGLKHRILTDIDQPITKIYNERRENGTAAPVPVFGAWKSTFYSIRKTVLAPKTISLSSVIIPDDMHYNNTK